MVLAAGALDLDVAFASHALRALELPSPRVIHVLSLGPGRHRLTRLDAGRFELAVEGDFFASPWSRNFSSSPLRPGTRLRLRDLALEVVAVEPETRLRLELPDGVGACWITSTSAGSSFFRSRRRRPCGRQSLASAGRGGAGAVGATDGDGV